MGDIFDTGHTTCVEGTQCKLSAGLANGLSRDDAYRFTHLYQTTSGQITSVAHSTNAMLEFARHRSADVGLSYTSLHDRLSFGFLDHLATIKDNLTSFWINSLSSSHTPENAFSQRLADSLRCIFTNPLASVGFTVNSVDDQILCHIHQPAGEVSSVSRTQRRISQPLARAVSGDEVFQGGQTFAEVGADRQGDDPPRRVSHQSTHTSQLADRLETTFGRT